MFQHPPDVDDRPPAPPRGPDSQDWRFAVVVLGVLLLAILGTGVALYVQDSTVPEGVTALASALVGALILLIGKRMVDH